MSIRTIAKEMEYLFHILGQLLQIGLILFVESKIRQSFVYGYIIWISILGEFTELEVAVYGP